MAFVSDRRAFRRASLDWQFSSHAHETLVLAYAEGVQAALESRGLVAPQHADVRDLATFIAGGSVALLTQWVREGGDGASRAAIVDRLLSVMPDWLISSTETCDPLTPQVPRTEVPGHLIWDLPFTACSARNVLHSLQTVGLLIGPFHFPVTELPYS